MRDPPRPAPAAPTTVAVGRTVAVISTHMYLGELVSECEVDGHRYAIKGTPLELAEYVRRHPPRKRGEEFLKE
jgi:hypothetical protein